MDVPVTGLLKRSSCAGREVRGPMGRVGHRLGDTPKKLVWVLPRDPEEGGLKTFGGCWKGGLKKYSWPQKRGLRLLIILEKGVLRGIWLQKTGVLAYHMSWKKGVLKIMCSMMIGVLWCPSSWKGVLKCMVNLKKQSLKSAIFKRRETNSAS